MTFKNRAEQLSHYSQDFKDLMSVDVGNWSSQSRAAENLSATLSDFSTKIAEHGLWEVCCSTCGKICGGQLALPGVEPGRIPQTPCFCNPSNEGKRYLLRRAEFEVVAGTLVRVRQNDCPDVSATALKKAGGKMP